MKMDRFLVIFGVKLIPGNMYPYLLSDLVSLTITGKLSSWREVIYRLCAFLRFSYIALCSLALLKCMDKIDVDKAVQYIVSCKNLDGGFGSTPGAESHAGQSMLL